MIWMATVSVDFDGVLHPYTAGWVGYTPADEPPIPGAAVFLAQLHDAGYRVVVSSARCDHRDGTDGIRDWLFRYNLSRYVSEVTGMKPPAIAYVDDRAVPYTGNFDAVLAGVAALDHPSVSPPAAPVPPPAPDWRSIGAKTIRRVAAVRGGTRAGRAAWTLRAPRRVHGDWAITAAHCPYLGEHPYNHGGDAWRIAVLEPDGYDGLRETAHLVVESEAEAFESVVWLDAVAQAEAGA